MHARQKDTLERMYAAYEEKVKRYRSWRASEKAMALATARDLIDELLAEPEDRIELFAGADGEWNWHRKAAGNWEVISRGEGYSSKLAAEYGARRANPDFKRGVIHVVEQLVPEAEEEPEVEKPVKRKRSRPNVGTAEKGESEKPKHATPEDQPYGTVHPLDPEALKQVPSRDEANKPK